MPQSVMTDWAQIHRDFVESFRRGWDRPGPHAWDDFLADDVRFVQPMLRDGSGPAIWWEEFARTHTLLPDLRGDVLSWAGSNELLCIHIRFTATLSGRPLTWDAVDLLRLSPAGKLLRRESFFDSAPIAAALISRPRSWMAWWRSGVGPLTSRRRILRRRPLVSTPTPGGS